MMIRAKWLVFLWGAVIWKALKDYGVLFLQFIDNAPYVIQIFGRHTQESSHQKDIALLGRKVEKQATSKDLIAQ